MGRIVCICLIITLCIGLLGTLSPVHADDSKFEKITASNADKVKLLATIDGHTENILALAFSHDSQWLASGSVDHTVKLWNIQDLSAVKPGAVLNGHSAQVAIVGFTSDGKTLISGGYDHSLHLWDVQSGKETSTQTDSGIALATLWNSFSPDMSLLAMGQDVGGTKLWDVKNGKIVESIINSSEMFMSGPQGPTAFAPDGQSLYIGDSKSNNVYQVPINTDKEDWKVVLTGTPDVTYFGPLVLSDDGAVLAVGTFNESEYTSAIDVFDVKEAKLLHTISSTDSDLTSISLTFNRDGTVLLSTGNDGNALWDVKTGKNLGSLPEKSILSPVFNADGTLVAGAVPRQSDSVPSKIVVFGIPAQ